MALIVATQLKALAESIVPALPASPSAEQIAARNAAVANTEDLVTKMCQYLVAQLEIKGVQVDTGTLHAAATPTVTPQDGGVTLYNSQLKPDVNNQTLNQNNDGKGLIE
jgi:hypothetical protein